MSDDEAHERARESAEEAGRTARERAGEEAERLTAEALAGPMKDEALRQLGLIYGGLILIGLYMVQPFLTAPSLDTSAKVSIIAFAVAIPLLRRSCWSTGRRPSVAAERRPSRSPSLK